MPTHAAIRPSALRLVQTTPEPARNIPSSARFAFMPDESPVALPMPAADQLELQRLQLLVQVLPTGVV
ncbi:MAG: hypothetical protein U5L01_16320 [Rheinheimera sp.]|nr:hypothetical protein [Rheinheimera sp.]